MDEKVRNAILKVALGCSVEEVTEEYGVTAEAQVNRRADGEFSYEKILIKITDFGINGQDEHIHISEEIERALESHYGCDAEVT